VQSVLVNEQYKVHILQVQASAVADEALSIRANRTLREVTAIYKKEEAGMDIVIRLPACYPLRVVEVECTRRLGISEALLRKWILSMAAFLRNQVCGFTGVRCPLLQNDEVSGYWGKYLHFRLVSSFRFLHCLAGTLQADAQCFLSLSHLQKVVGCYIW
jgi:hypothetical protein